MQSNVLSRYAKYGFTLSVPSETPQEGDRLRWSIETSKGPLIIDNYYMPRETYKESLMEAGFEKIKFYPFELDPNREGFGRNFAIAPFSHLEDANSNDKKESLSLDYLYQRSASSLGKVGCSKNRSWQNTAGKAL